MIQIIKCYRPYLHWASKRVTNKFSHCQGVKHFKDIQYNRQSKYGEILQQQEYEMSCFNLEEASIQIYHQLYDLYEQAGCTS